MAEYIEREKATKILRKEAANHYPTAFHVGLFAAARAIDAIPAADVRPVVRGKWKLASYSGKYGSAKGKWYDQFLDGAFWYCDNCKERAAKRTNFCPNCGADMREES